MSYHDHAKFNRMRADLGRMLVATASQFAAGAKLDPLRKESLGQMSVPVEAVAAELLMFGCDAWPNSAASPEDSVTPLTIAAYKAPPSRCRPIMWVLLALAGSTLFTVGFDYLVDGPPPNFFFSFAITAIALMFGSTYGVALGLLCPLAAHFIVHQLSLDPPVQLPTLAYEALVAIYHLSLAIIIPWMVIKALSFRTLVLGRPFGADPLKRALGLV